MPSKQIIILHVRALDTITLQVCYWVPVPAGQEVLFQDSTKRSRYSNITPQELADLRAGKFVERVEHVPITDPSSTPAQIAQQLEARYTELTNQVASLLTVLTSGAYRDATGWHLP